MQNIPKMNIQKTVKQKRSCKTYNNEHTKNGQTKTLMQNMQNMQKWTHEKRSNKIDHATHAKNDHAKMKIQNDHATWSCNKRSCNSHHKGRISTPSYYVLIGPLVVTCSNFTPDCGMPIAIVRPPTTPTTDIDVACSSCFCVRPTAPNGAPAGFGWQRKQF